MENEEFLHEQQAKLTEMVRPYQREVNRRQRLVDFVNRCIRCAGRDDFFQLYELLQSRPAADVEAEPGYEDARDVFERLRQDVVHKVERYQVQFIDDLTRRVTEADLPLEGTFPRFGVLKGIDIEVDFPKKRYICVSVAHMDRASLIP